MSQNAAFDASIPVLTEVFDDRPPAQGASAPATAPSGLEARALDSFGQHEWEALERRLSERILRQLQGRVDFVLEQRLRDSMADVLQHALAGLTNELRAGLNQTIEMIVARAVTQELAHLQAQKK